MFARGVAILGPLEARDAERVVPVPGAKVRVVLALLALDNGRTVTTHALKQALWGEDPPPTAANALQVHVGTVRRALGELDLAGRLETVPQGYRLSLPRGRLDRDVFLESRGLAATARAEGRWDAAALHLRECLSVWRGPALADLADVPVVQERAGELNRLELDAFESFAENELDLRRERELLVTLERRAHQNPLRESMWALLALALYRADQQAAALAALRRVRRTLDEELGVAPGERLRDLEVRMLRQDPGLGAPPRPTDPETELTVTEQRSDLPTIAATLSLPDGRTVRVDRPAAVLGRSDSADVAIPVPGVSGRHARIVATVHGHVLEDLLSTNGTYVNGEPVTRQLLVSGDVIELGRTPVRYERVTPP